MNGFSPRAGGGAGRSGDGGARPALRPGIGRAPRGWRVGLIRTLAVSIGLAPFAACEGVLRALDWLVDHVHPSIRGHRLVARVLIDERAREGLLARVPGWESERDRRYEAQIASLDEFYFLQGQKHLGNLRLWAQGRGDRVRPRAKSAASTDRVATVRDAQASRPAPSSADPHRADQPGD